MSDPAKQTTRDRIVLFAITTVLIYSVVIFTTAYLAGEDMGAWVWGRHQNLFSWYSRPIFIIPAAYYAYHQKIWQVLGFMALLGTSLFWFEAPTVVPASVSEYLEWEKQLFFVNESLLPIIALSIAVAIFLFSFFYAFWKRNAWYGLVIINIGTVLKIVVSVAFGQQAGLAAIVPSLSSLFLINTVAWFVWRRKRKASSDGRRTER